MNTNELKFLKARAEDDINHILRELLNASDANCLDVSFGHLRQDNKVYLISNIQIIY